MKYKWNKKLMFSLKKEMMGPFLWSCAANTMYLAQCQEGAVKVQSDELGQKHRQVCCVTCLWLDLQIKP